MSGQCTGTPVSWLRLEQWALGELPAPDAEQVAAHVETCVACRACADQAAVQAVALSALPAMEAPSRSWMWWGGGLLAAAVVLALIVTRPGDDFLQGDDVFEVGSGGVKGGGLAIELVRESAGSVAQDPTRFAPGDRFKLLVTCAPGQRTVDVVVYQPGEVSFPLAPATLSCGNRVAVPGAFSLNGGPAQVCVVVQADGGPSRVELRDASRPPADATCLELLPAP